MVKGKKQDTPSVKEKASPKNSSTQTPGEIFKLGMNFENTIEYIESKILDAFFGHISRQGEWDLAEQYILNVKEWCQMLKSIANFELNFLSKSLQEKIISMGQDLESGIDELLKAISERNFEKANKDLEKILRLIRELYQLRE